MKYETPRVTATFDLGGELKRRNNGRRRRRRGQRGSHGGRRS